MIETIEQEKAAQQQATDEEYDRLRNAPLDLVR